MKRLLTGALALSLLISTAAMAKPDHGDRDHSDDHGGYSEDRDRSFDRGDKHDKHDKHNKHDNRDFGRHGGNGHHWGRGERLSRDYYEDRGHYVDYRVYHLRRPPPGYRWVRTDDNNYAMVALATGLIAAIIASNR